MVLKRFLVIYSFAVLIFSCTSNQDTESYQEENQNPIEAKDLFVLHCESCHGLDGTKGVSGAANLQKSSISENEIEAVIKNGNEKGMMPYKDIITGKSEIKSLVEYVKNLRK